MSMIIYPARYGAAGGDPYFANVGALLKFDGTDGSIVIPDVTGKVWTPSGNAQLDTAIKKFGTAALLLDGTGDYISTPAHASLTFGPGPYTIEGQIYNTGTGDRCIFDNRSASTQGIAIYSRVVSGGTNSLTVYDNVGRICASPNIALTNSIWTYFAVVRDGTTVYAYIEGVQTASGTDARTLAAAPTFIGANYLGTQAYAGLLDEIRISNVCRYPGGITFTPPSAPFPTF